MEAQKMEAQKMDAHVGNRRGRVVLFPLPFQGHITPIFQLAALLHRRGFSIIILHTVLNYPDTTRHPDFRFVPIQDGLGKYQPGGNAVGQIRNLNINCAEPFRQWVLAEEEGIDCVITDAHMYSVQAEADKLGLRNLVLRTGSAECCNVFFAFPMLWEKGYLPVRDSNLEDLVSELPPLRVKDLPQLGPIDSSKHENFSQLLSCLTGGIRASSGLILNTFDALEEAEADIAQQQASVPVFCIGPLHHFSSHTSSSLLPQDHSCMGWLDQQPPNSVVYVSFGSVASMDLDEFVQTAWGLSDSGQPFLWVVRPNSVRGCDGRPELPSEFEEETRGRGKVIEWAPQQAVLAHPAVGAFWTHNGWNSTIESLSEGVPMLCRPFFGDQMMNARYVCELWKVGVMAGNGMERGGFCEAIQSLMGEGGVEMRHRAKDLKENSRRCMESGGSSVKALDKLVEFILSS